MELKFNMYNFKFFLTILHNKAMNRSLPEVSTNPDLTGFTPMPDITDYQTCKNTCTYGNGCQKWTYDVSNNTCYQKYRPGPSLPEVTTNPDLTGYTLMPDINDLHTCRSTCRYGNGCKKWTYDINTGECYQRFDAEPTDDYPAEDTTIDINIPSAFDSERINYMPFTKCTGINDTATKTSTQSDCMNLCRNNTNCNHWSYDKSAGTCVYGPNKAVCGSDRNYTSGFIGQKPGPPPVYRVSIPMDDIAYIPNEANRFSTSASTQDECQNKCINDDTCAAWTYYNNVDDNRACLLTKGKSDTVFKVPHAVSGRTYNVMKLPQ